MEEPKLLVGKIFTDDRGCIRFINDFDFSKVKRFYQIQNHIRGFIRAWHGHRKEGKYVYVAKGTALVAAVKLDDDRAVPVKFVLSDKVPTIFCIPPGYANGFMSLEEDTIVQFFSTALLEESIEDAERISYDRWDIWNINYR